MAAGAACDAHGTGLGRHRGGAGGAQGAGDVHLHRPAGLDRGGSAHAHLALGLQQHVAPSRQGAAAQSAQTTAAQDDRQILRLGAHSVGASQREIATVDLQACGLACGEVLALQDG